MTAREIRWLLGQVGLRQRDVAQALAVSEPTVSRVLAGTYRIRTEASRETANRIRAYVAAKLAHLPGDAAALVAPLPPRPAPCGSAGHRTVRTCRACRRQYQRAHRPAQAALPEPARQRANARGRANVAQARGQLTPQPCEQCGATPAEKHHDDYARPLDVRWLCPPCHRAHHAAQRTGKFHVKMGKLHDHE